MKFRPWRRVTGRRWANKARPDQEGQMDPAGDVDRRGL